MKQLSILTTRDFIASKILFLRCEKVLLDADLALLYGVETRHLNQAVKRNADRFPGDFMFELTRDEFNELMSQIVTSNKGRGSRRKLLLAFTDAFSAPQRLPASPSRSRFGRARPVGRV